MTLNILTTVLAATFLCSASATARPTPPADRATDQAASMQDRPPRDRNAASRLDDQAGDIGRRGQRFNGPRNQEGAQRGGRPQAMRDGLGPRQRMMLHQLRKRGMDQFRGRAGFPGRGGFAGPQRRGGEGLGRGPNFRGADRFRRGGQFGGPNFGDRGITGRRPPLSDSRRGFRGEFEQRGRGMSPRRAFPEQFGPGARGARPDVGTRPREFDRGQMRGDRRGPRFQSSGEDRRGADDIGPRQ